MAGSVLGLYAAKETGSKSPELKIDDSAVSDGQSTVVTSYADVVEPVQQTVVSVYSTKKVRQQMRVNPLLRQFFGDQVPQRESEEQGLGSGVIVSADGYVLTNNHVVAGADSLQVLLPDGREFEAELIGADPKTDVAVIKIKAENLPVATLADSDKLRVGDVVFAVGNPLGIGQTVTMGIVSAKGRNNLGLLEDGGGYEDFIQTDAAINMGNSGGALVDAKGRLVGINTAIISTTRGNIGIGFAVPVNLAASVMHSLIETGDVQRGYLGVQPDNLTADLAKAFDLPEDQKGVVIAQVYPDSPAEKAGIKRDDIVVAINGREVKSLQDLRLMVSQFLPGTEVSLKVLRDGKEQTIKVELGKLTDAGLGRQLLEGVDVTRVTDELRRQFGIAENVDGLVITAIDPESPYARRLAVGAVIVEVNREAVKDLGSARSLMRDGRNLLLVYYRGTFRYLAVDSR